MTLDEIEVNLKKFNYRGFYFRGLIIDTYLRTAGFILVDKQERLQIRFDDGYPSLPIEQACSLSKSELETVLRQVIDEAVGVKDGNYH